MSEFAPPQKEKKPKRGVAGTLFFVCASIGAAGLGADIALSGPVSWLGAEPGARAVIGFGVAVIAALGAHGARFVLGGRDKNDPGAGDA